MTDCTVVAEPERDMRREHALNERVVRHASTVIEDLAELGKSMFFVFDMAGRLDPKVTSDEKTSQWVVPLRK
ncbi:hypothetical protein Y032_0025g1248 [Ancylostoma ceylanicum]|uniref:Uncharacterized protein n=1 Tax=Ancylostoma ceylanicum TaxID=53326 RepID=A0A016UW39_9BILA|nr:hypothetical protein Y032_0025g1248 [Ancylostoma ceylanicum]